MRSSTNEGLILDQCNGKIKLITHLCCPFRTNYRSSHQRCSKKKGVLEISQNAQEKTFTGVIKFLNKVAGLQACVLTKKETPAQVLAREFCKISKITFFTEHLWTTPSMIIWIFTDICIVILSTKFVAQGRI